MIKLKKKIVVVTGSSGILGEQFIKYLINQNYIVIGLDKKYTLDKDLIKTLNKNFFFYKVDLTSQDSLIEIVNLIKKDIGIPYGLVNNAAMDTPPSKKKLDNSFENLKQSYWDSYIQNNLNSVFLPTQIIGKIMIKQKMGSIVNISSIYGSVSPDPKIYFEKKDKLNFVKPFCYSISKGALNIFTKYLAVHWAKYNIRVNCISFGGVKGTQDKNFLKNYSARVPIGRLANKDEYNSIINFLLSKDSSYMTGSNIFFDGGWTSI